MRRHVESRVRDLYAFGSNLLTPKVRDFFVRPRLDRNLVAGVQREVNRRERRRNIEGYVVLVRRNRNHIGSDLIGDVSICGDAIRPNDHAIDFARLQEVPGHAIGDQRNRNVLLRKLPGRQPRALKERPGLIGVDSYLFAGFDRRVNNSKRRSKPCSSKGAGVAMSQNSRVVGNELGAEASHSVVALDILAMNIERLADELLSYLVDRSSLTTAVLESPSHPFDRPEQIHRRRPGYQQPLANAMKVSVEFVQRRGIRVLHSKGNAHRGGHTDGGRASDDHVFDCPCYFVVSLEDRIQLVGWKPPLINHYDAFVGPLDGSNHGRKDDSE